MKFSQHKRLSDVMADFETRLARMNEAAVPLLARYHELRDTDRDMCDDDVYPLAYELAAMARDVSGGRRYYRQLDPLDLAEFADKVAGCVKILADQRSAERQREQERQAAERARQAAERVVEQRERAELRRLADLAAKYPDELNPAAVGGRVMLLGGDHE